MKKVLFVLSVLSFSSASFAENGVVISSVAGPSCFVAASDNSGGLAGTSYACGSGATCNDDGTCTTKNGQTGTVRGGRAFKQKLLKTR